MKLTKTKLKQMIKEAIKNKRFQDFGIPTPDEKLKADLGDEMFDKIQATDPEQAEIFKQSFDPNYPSSIKQESLNDVLEPLGFKELDSFGNRDNVSKEFYLGEFRPNIPTYKAVLDFGYSKYYEKNPKNTEDISYFMKIEKVTISGPTALKRELLLEKKAQLGISKSFYVDMTDQQQREEIESLIVKKEKAAILKALEELT